MRASHSSICSWTSKHHTLEKRSITNISLEQPLVVKNPTATRVRAISVNRSKPNTYELKPFIGCVCVSDVAAVAMAAKQQRQLSWIAGMQLNQNWNFRNSFIFTEWHNVQQQYTFVSVYVHRVLHTFSYTWDHWVLYVFFDVSSTLTHSHSHPHCVCRLSKCN